MGLRWGYFKWGKARWSNFTNLVTDRTKTDLDNGTPKAFYNYDDLNRVESAVEYIATKLTEQGYFTTVVVKTDWQLGDKPSSLDMKRYLSNVQKCIDTFTSAGYNLPKTMDGIDYIGANNIEKTLADIEQLINNMIAAMRNVGTFYCGDMDGLRGYCL